MYCRCHWGPCPPCTHFCGTPLPCGHACCSPSCHDRPHKAAPAFQQPLPPSSDTFTATKPVQNSPQHALGPAAQIAEEVNQEGSAAFQTSCPPCQAPVLTPCLGGHTSKALPCSSAAPFSCGAECQQPLACGNHTCSKPCHELLHPRGEIEQTGVVFRVYQTVQC